VRLLSPRGATWLLFLSACSSGSGAESAVPPRPIGEEASQAIEDSISSLVEAYKGGRLSRGQAAKHLADLIEPLSGFASQTTDSMELDLFEATRIVLRERMAARYNLPDTLR
jgi:hypothetical protein